MSRLRLHRANRLTERSDYLRCYDVGRRGHTKNFLVFIAARPERTSPWRFGMAVTKKTGSAVVRNRLRRLIRESIRLLQDKIAPGTDYVVVPKKTLDPSSLGQAAVGAELLPLLQGTFRSKGG